MAEGSKVKFTLYGSQTTTQETINKYPYGYQALAVTAQKGSINDQKLLDSMGAATEKAAQDKATAVLKNNPGYLEGAQTTFTQVDPEYVVATTNLSFYTSKPTTVKLNTPTPGSVKDTDTSLRPVEGDPRAPSVATGSDRRAINPETGPVTNTPSNSADNKVKDDSGQSGTGTNTGTSTGTSTGTNTETSTSESSGSGTSASSTSVGTEKAVPPSKRNPLSNYSSVSYILSLYAITPQANEEFKNTGKWDLSKLILLIQNGGINNTPASNRSPYFNYDFTIDDLEIMTVMNPKEMGSSNNNITFKFKIFEPYSMTLTSRLAVQQQEIVTALKNDNAQEINALALPLLLGIKFLGYDENGQILNSSTLGQMSTGQQPSDGSYFRAFPIIISKMTFKLENKTTVYDVTGVIHNNFIAFGTARGTTQGPMTVNAETVEEAIKQIIKVFNDKQEDLSTGSKKQQDYPDKYEYKILDKIIGDAFIADPTSADKTRTGSMLLVKSSLESNIKKSVTTIGVNQAKRQVEFASGTPIMKVFEQVISQSTFVGDALATVQKEEDPVLDDQTDTTNNPNPKELFWFNVTPQVFQDTTKWDTKRQQHPSTITYYIKKYKVPYVQAVGIEKTSTYPGPTKIYNYFYTGENTEVLQYEQTYNLAYYLTMSAVADANQSSPAKGVPANPGVATPGSPVGKQSDKNSIIGGITNSLYSPGDQIKAQITILGDPDYLMPSICNPLTKNAGIDPSLGQVFIEIEFKAVEDYNTILKNGTLVDSNDGLMTPNDNIKFWRYDLVKQGIKSNAMVYMVVGVISKFSKGVFTQLLKTVLPNLVSLNVVTPTSNTDNRPAPTSAPKRITDTPVPTVTIGEKIFPVLVPELDPAKRPLMNPDANRPLPTNLQPKSQREGR